MNSKRQVKAKIWSYDINWPLLFAVNGIFNLSIESKIIISRLDLSNVEQKVVQNIASLQLSLRPRAHPKIRTFIRGLLKQLHSQRKSKVSLQLLKGFNLPLQGLS